MDADDADNADAATRFAKWVKKGLKEGDISPGPPAFGQPGRKKDCNDLSGD
jgi:hypothetical protein